MKNKMCIRDRAYADGGIEENAYNLNYTFEANTAVSYTHLDVYKRQPYRTV